MYVPESPSPERLCMFWGRLSKTLCAGPMNRSKLQPVTVPCIQHLYNVPESKCSLRKVGQSSPVCNVVIMSTPPVLSTPLVLSTWVSIVNSERHQYSLMGEWWLSEAWFTCFDLSPSSYFSLCFSCLMVINTVDVNCRMEYNSASLVLKHQSVLCSPTLMITYLFTCWKWYIS